MSSRQQRKNEATKRCRDAWSPERKELEKQKARARAAARYARLTVEQRQAKIDRGAQLRYARTARMRAAKEQAAELARVERAEKAKVWKVQNRVLFEKSPSDLYARISKAVPRTFHRDVRDDVISDIAVALLDGEISHAEIETLATRFISSHFKFREWHQLLSIDGTVTGNDNLRIVDTIAEDRVCR